MDGRENYKQLDLFLNNEARVSFVPTMDSKQREILTANTKLSQKRTSLFSKFKNVAMSVYQTYEWDDEDLLEAARDIYIFIGFRTNVKTSTNQVEKALFISKKHQKLIGLFGKSDQSYCIPIYYSMVKKEVYQRFLVLSDSKSLANYYTDTYFKKRNKNIRYAYLSKEYLLGYSYIINAIIDDFSKKDPGKLGFSSSVLYEILKGLISGPRANDYMYYDYAITNTQSLRRMQNEAQDKIRFFEANSSLVPKGEEPFILSRYLDYKKALDYIKSFLNKHYSLVNSENQEQDV